MYLAQSTSTSQVQAPFYIKMLENLIEDKDFNERESIDSAIKEAKDIANGEKEIFSISNKNYFFVSTLLTRYKDNLIGLKSNHFDKETYSGILEILR